ncbi:MAG: phosphate transporter ATP-binding protein, PhoT family, partial [Deltaproteobacteria bacterium]|nr:phosphate transporter ATP-binding protein, PhoT family [Deltaproteobacteria bacterium]
MANIFEINDLSGWFRENQVLKKIRMGIGKNSVTSVMGPSGCGKSTFIRCLNRMHDMTPG